MIQIPPRALRAYYDELKAYGSRRVEHESAVRSAFQNLLADTARPLSFQLVAEAEARSGGRRVRPDGTLYDQNGLPRGYWEAKDTHDRLDAEIQRKIEKGYPLTNTIFEDTRQAVLYQDRREVLRVDLLQPGELTELLRQFYSYVEPDIAGFEQAVEEFGGRVPELAKGLTAKIRDAHRDRGFNEAFESFYSLCRDALNPNLSRAAVEEMLVQHLLTERLIRRIFDDADFTRRNVIAAEVERVIDALVRTRWNRGEYLKSLDRFYLAIEDAARSLPDFSEKQHFLNTVYERFFQGYSVKVADTHGIVYTPQAIVDFMCGAVEEVLESEFGRKLSGAEVCIIDPCTGTGNFIVNLLRRIPKRDLPRMYAEQLFANEVMLLPYYIAALNIEHAYYERTGEYKAFEGLCFVDTLDLAEGRQGALFTEENTARVERQRTAPITVVIGNPPYNVGQINENDNNKNRRYPVVDGRISETYARDSTATLKNKLSDAYVKFFRWASDRLQDRDGVVCFVSNNSFVSQIAFDGMRKHLMRDFQAVWHLDLQGNVRKNPKLSGTAYNVFGIQVGVGITVAVRRAARAERALYYHAVPLGWRRQEKLEWLDRTPGLKAVQWERLTPDDRNTWLVPEHAKAFAEFTPVTETFSLHSLGVASNRDEWVYDFDAERLTEKVKRLIKNYNYELFRLQQEDQKPTDIDEFVNNSPSFLKWTDRLKQSLIGGKALKFSKGCISEAIYRPFTSRLLYFDSLLVHRRYRQAQIFPLPNASDSKLGNVTICATGIGSERPFMVLIARTVPDLHLVGAGCGSQCFPLYTYDPDGTNRRDNITPWALDRFRTHYGTPAITAEDIFYYVYGILHHAGYREKFAENLKRELPRIPLAADFEAFACAGRELARLHLDYEKLPPYPLRWIETPGVPLSFRVEDKMRLARDRASLAVNPSLALAGIPAETYDYRLGNRSALEWVIDQYQVSEDARSGIRSDPNREDDSEYIVRLVGQVVRVSLETVRIVKGLPSSC